MLTFFRRIRKVLLDGGRIDDPSRRMTASTSKYLLYAIGEILLVVIGILIALQINNWNEWRMTKLEEKAMLNEINENVVTCVEELKSSVSFVQERLNSLSVVIKYMSQDLPHHDTLDSYFYNLNSFPTPDFASGAYETLKSKGLDLISNSDLRKDIVKTFDEILPQLALRVTYDGQMRHQEFHNTEYISHFKILSQDLGDNVNSTFNYTGVNSKIVPTNYLELIHDDKYENLLRSLYDNNQWFVVYMERTIALLQELKLEIMYELGEADL